MRLRVQDPVAGVIVTIRIVGRSEGVNREAQPVQPASALLAQKRMNCDLQAGSERQGAARVIAHFCGIM
jgi:hypothetical protein